jgi:hypothetical protein
MAFSLGIRLTQGADKVKEHAESQVDLTHRVAGKVGGMVCAMRMFLPANSVRGRSWGLSGMKLARGLELGVFEIEREVLGL